ncbi:HTH-type transcriptional regulator NorG-like [Tubulanus polymorphus]|uniref:HTH-type transcriptional regulator NorG-like n=1 Tax=Tubulanus polymorphus TaxID=672921 RepID=UPI003DA4E2F4
MNWDQSPLNGGCCKHLNPKPNCTEPPNEEVQWDLGDGNPDKFIRCNAARVMLKATNHRIPKDLTNDALAFVYGNSQGDPEFRENLAMFLSKEYGDTVNRDDLFLTVGTFHALYILKGILFSKKAVIYVEEPTFYFAREVIPEIGYTVTAVPSNRDGIIVEELDRLVQQDGEFKKTETQPYRAMVYLISVFNNPGGYCYSLGRCKELIKLARRYDLLIFADDVNSLLHYSGSAHAPKRLLAYDDKSDADYADGNVVSNGSFSKIFAPSVRCGWLEAPRRLIDIFKNSVLCDGCGITCQYVSTILSSALALGLIKEHLDLSRREYGRKLKKTCQLLKDQLPKSAIFAEPQDISEGGSISDTDDKDNSYLHTVLQQQ